MGNKDSDKYFGISRREFIKLAAVAFGGLPFITNRDLPVETMLNPETEKVPSALVLDIFGLNRLNLQPQVQLNLILEYLKNMGLTDVERYLEQLATNEVGKTILMMDTFSLVYVNHGDKVIQAGQKADAAFGLPPVPPRKESIIRDILFNGISHDSIENPIVNFCVNPQSMISKIKSSNDPLVNLSLEAGNMGIRYEMYENISGETSLNRREIPVDSRRLVPVDGYAVDSKQVYKNLSVLTDIARACPGKVIIAAAGNPVDSVKPDIREARQLITAENGWPDKLFMIGTWGPKSGPDSYGADFYINKKDMRTIFQSPEISSSFAVPIARSALGRLLYEGMNSPQKLRANYLGICENKGYRNNPEYVLNPLLVKNLI